MRPRMGPLLLPPVSAVTSCCSSAAGRIVSRHSATQEVRTIHLPCRTPNRNFIVLLQVKCQKSFLTCVALLHSTTVLGLRERDSNTRHTKPQQCNRRLEDQHYLHFQKMALGWLQAGVAAIRLRRWTQSTFLSIKFPCRHCPAPRLTQ